jgi:hypothetical protein
MLTIGTGDRSKLAIENISSHELKLFLNHIQIMKRFLTSTSIIFGLTLALVPTIASAQSAGFGNSGDNRDPFSRASTGDTSGLMRLLNESQLNGRNNPNYRAEQKEQIDSATTDFRARQMQMLRERNKKTVPATTTPVK